MKPPSERKESLVEPILAFLASLAIAAVIISEICIDITITPFGLLRTTNRLIWVTGITVLATLLTGFIGSEITSLLAESFDHRLEKWDLFSDSTPNNSKLNSRWRAILGLSGFKDKIHNWKIWLLYGIVSLLTTAIVGSLTPSLTTKTQTYRQKVYNGWQRICTEIYPLKTAKANGIAYFWDLHNGSAYVTQANWGGCPTRDAQLLLGEVNFFDSNSFAYSDGGVSVHRRAIGAPMTIYSPERRFAPEFYDVLGTYRSSLVNITQCVRVMTKNPISCRPGAAMSLSSTWFNVTSDNGLCELDWYTPSRNPLQRQLVVKTICAHGDVGQGTIVMAATNQYAHWLAVAINDEANAPPTGSASSKYALSCTVDTRDAYEYRQATLQLQPFSNSTSRIARLLTSTGESCTGPPLDRSLAAITAAANWQTLLQNDGLDGWPDLLWEATGNGRDPPYAFPHSKNALEDTLGVVAALVGSRWNLTSFDELNSTAVFIATRIGSGSWEVILYIIPPVFAALLLTLLMIANIAVAPSPLDSTDLRSLMGYSQKVSSEGRGRRVASRLRSLSDG